MYEPSERGVSAAQPWLERQGIVRPLAWGYVAMLLFMVGDGVEVGFLATYLEVVGFTTADVATLVAVYGVVVALASWLSGALVEAWGPRRVMMIGLRGHRVRRFAYRRFDVRSPRWDCRPRHRTDRNP
nr:hypothetical protein [Rhodococcus sp. JT-3]